MNAKRCDSCRAFYLDWDVGDKDTFNKVTPDGTIVAFDLCERCHGKMLRFVSGVKGKRMGAKPKWTDEMRKAAGERMRHRNMMRKERKTATRKGWKAIQGHKQQGLPTVLHDKVSP